MVIFHCYVSSLESLEATGWRKIHDLIAEIWGHWPCAIPLASFWFPAKTLSAVPWPAGFLVLPAFRFDGRPQKSTAASSVQSGVSNSHVYFKDVWYSDDILMIWWLLNRCPILEILRLHQIHQYDDHYFLQSSNQYNSSNNSNNTNNNSNNRNNLYIYIHIKIVFPRCLVSPHFFGQTQIWTSSQFLQLQQGSFTNFREPSSRKTLYPWWTSK